MAISQDICNENIEAIYEKHKHFGDSVYQEYEELYKKMWTKINVSYLEPFSKILMEHEAIALKGRDELVQTIRENLELKMQQALHSFWHSYNVREALNSLEICKEKFREYEGIKWNMDEKTPWERTRPIRMRYKENRVRYLQTQLIFQNKQLEETLQENVFLRQRIQNIKHQRTLLYETMENFRKDIKMAKVKIIEFQNKLIAENYDNIEPAIDAENELIQS